MRRARRTAIGVVVVLGLLAVLALGGCAASKPSVAETRDQCFSNETVIRAEMSLFKADSGLDAPLSDVLDKTHLVCPSGGTYSYDATTGVVTCSVHGHP